MLPRLYDRLISGLAVLGAIALAATVFAIAIDVLLRNVGLRPIQATSALIEYALLFATMAGAPWLVRERGHIAITSFVDILPNAVRAVANRLMVSVCIAILALLSWRAAAVMIEVIESGAVDIRSIALPSWILYAMLCGGFGLMAAEFLRILLRGETYSGDDAVH
ncbi:TRAP transporter small permease [Rhodobacteraceae bacterium F11138]|nr:TRAP transporter small permease [Rhodobacteraceae bacterium F11138]